MDQENNQQSTYSQHYLTKQQNISFTIIYNNACRRIYKLQRILLLVTICLLLFPKQISSYRINNLQDQLKIVYFGNIIDDIKTILTVNNSNSPIQSQDNNKNLLKQNNINQQSTNGLNDQLNITKIQNQVQQYSKKFHSFIYPYNIYDVRYLTVKKLRQLIPEIGQNINTNLKKHQTNKTVNFQQIENKNQSQTTQLNITNTTDDSLLQKFNQTIVAKQLFLFLKIDQCVNVKICKYFDMIPNNIILITNSNNQMMNLYKVSQNQFVVQSIVNQKNNSAETQKQQQGYSNNRVGSIVDLYNININNFIYFKINQPSPHTFLRLQKLLIKSQVFRNMHNNQYWDVAYNGSSLRFVRLIKRQITINNSKQSNITQILQNDDKDIKIQYDISKRLKKIPQRYKNTAQQLQKLNKNTTQQLTIIKNQPNSISYINTLQILQFSINLHQQNRQYITKFDSHQYTSPQLYYKNNKKQLTYRRNMIGNSYNNNFYIFITTPINRSQRVIRIFGSSLSELLLISQIYARVYNRDNTFLQKMSRQNRQDILVYYKQFIKQHRSNRKLITLGQLIFRQLDSNNTKVSNYQCKYNISYILQDEIEQQNQPKISKISNQFISICINTRTQAYCQIIHISCKLVYSYTILQNIIGNKTIIWNYIGQQLQYFNHIIQAILYDQFNQTQQLYLTIRIAISQQSLSTNLQFQINPILNNQTNNKYINILENRLSINSTTSDQIQSYYSYSQNDSSLNSTYYTEIHMKKLSQIQQGLYFNQTIYTDRQKYRYMIGTMMMQKKLAILLKNIWYENVAQQEDNCQLVYVPRKKDDNKNSSQLIGIGFGNLINKKLSSPQEVNQTQQTSNPVWRICRISLQSYHQNLVIEPQYQSMISHNKTLQHPYTIYRCSFLNSSTTSKCLYAEWQANKRLLLPQNAKTILFIINHGQTYNLKISDLNTIQMDKIAQSFLIMFLSLSMITCLFTCIIVCRPLCIISCMYLGWSNQINQGNFNFRYPLNCFEVMLKMRKMMAQRIIKQINYKKSKHHSSQIALQQQIEDDCVFCLQPKLSGLLIIQVYCKHSYHKQCFEEWVRQQSGQLNCPMCKRKINLQGFMQYQNIHDNLRQEEIEM